LKTQVLFASERNLSSEVRQVLVSVLEEQYKGIKPLAEVNTNIQLLKLANTFTITTGHQLNLATGHLYFILKLITAINTAKELAKQYPEKNYVPIYWMATEDHDFEEINHFHLYGKTNTWLSHQTGAVGRFTVDALTEMFPSLTDIPEILSYAYQQGDTLAFSTRKLVHTILGQYGIVCLDADHPELKKIFAPIIKEELLHAHSESLVNQTIADLKDKGYKNQVNPRTINLFYLANNVRERIEKNGAVYQVLNTDLQFSEKEILNLLRDHPDYFSPNVVLRPLYQSLILPDVATVGGPSEVAYWLQLKPLFDFYQVSFPLLMPRNFVMLANVNQQHKLEKLGLSLPDLFQDQNMLKRQVLALNEKNIFDTTYEADLLDEIRQSLLKKVQHIDATLESTVGAECTKMTKILDDFEKKVQKALERKNETAINQVMNIKTKLFPNDGLQERHDNFFSFYVINQEIIQVLVDDLDPFDFIFNVLTI
jgi:bacillithiol biosynthesis cysteine-adding enzyme BshC